MEKPSYYLYRLAGSTRLLYLFSDSYIYSTLRKKFPDYYENRDRKILLDYCPEMKEVLEEMDFFYKKVPPSKVSYQERKDRNILDDKTLTYGESTWKGLIDIIEAAEIKPDDLFYDLGSGSGKIIFLVNKKFGIKGVGIEFIEYFTKMSNIIKKKLDLERIKFINSDFFKEDFSKGTIFYMTATCFNDQIMERMSEKFKKLKEGSRIITITRPLKGEHLELYKKKIVEFGWSKDHVFFYRKV
jgi:SAM-dependent methyltransferase